MNQPNPYQAPRVTQTSAPVLKPDFPSQGIWSDGKYLVVSKMVTLPPVCVLTNQESERSIKRNFYWHHPALYFSILGGILIYVIVVLVLRKSQKLAIPLSEPALQKRKKTLLLSWTFGVACVAISVAAIMGLCIEAFGYRREWIGVLLLFCGFVGLLTTAVIGSRFAGILAPKKITKHAGWYKGACPEYLERFPDLPPNVN